MSRAAGYKTKQKSEILAYLRTRPGEHLTAGELAEHLRSEGCDISVTTVYRQLNQLLAAGQVKKYQLDSQTAACFEYTGGERCEHQHCFHFKCESCGKLIHFHCQELEQAEKHMLENHGFDLDSLRTVFYGLCDQCSAREQAVR